MSNRNKKKITKSISLIIALLCIGTIFYNNINVKAVDKTPYLKVDFSANPNPVVVVEDVDITCTITPQPFEITTPEKEIVLVLDVSGSMNDVIETEYCQEPSFFGYCAVHFPQRAGHALSSKTKMEAAKDAAKGFVDKMKNVENLKIGIVAFSSYGIINPREATTSIIGRNYSDNFYQTYGYDLISSSNVTTLNNIINNLGAEGGTNTGDGLRSAAYLLNKSSDTANKTIVLMSDGLPTFSSYISSKNSNSFVDITKATGGYPNDTGNGAADNGDSTYAKKIGGVIKQKGYNVYSIGYGLGNSNSTSNILLKSIHESMGGTTGINGTFFADDSGSIDAIFNSIGDKIIDSYEVKDVEINLNLSEDFQLATGVSKVTLPEDKKIVYRKAASSTSTVTRYEADPVQFTFKIKANKESINTTGTVFGSGTVTYKDWYGKEESVNLNPINIKVNPLNNIPDIQAELVGASPNPVYPGEEVEITYKVTPEEFTSKVMNTESGVINEVIFITDLSQMMTQGNRFSVLQNGITNRILNNTTLNKTKFGVIGYNNSVSIGDRNNENNPQDVSMKNITDVNALVVPMFDISNANSKDGFRQLFQSGKMALSSHIASNSTRNIDAALTMAKNTFNKFGTANNRKAVVLINAGNVNYTSDIVQDIKSQGYKVISLDISAATNTNLQSFHQDLGGDSSDYLVGTISGGNYNAVDTDMTKIADRLISGVINRAYSPIKAKLNFDLNNNFEYVNNSVSNNITNTVLSGEKLVLELAPINYTYAEKTADNNYRYTASEMIISFRVKSKNGITGEVSFANNPAEIENLKNFISHNRFNGTEVRKAIDTPSIMIGSSNIQHGVYEGIKNPAPIYTGDPRNFAKGAKVPMGALFNTIRDESNISLTVSPQLTVNGDVKIYKVNDGGQLEFIDNMAVSDNKVYSYRLNTEPGTKVLVLYNVTTPEVVGTHTSTIYVGTENRDAVIKSIDENLPDLF